MVFEPTFEEFDRKAQNLPDLTDTDDDTVDDREDVDELPPLGDD